MLYQNAYAVFSILGYSIGLGTFFFLAKKRKRDWSESTQIAAIALIASLFGAKIFHTLFEAPGHALPNGEVTRGIVDLLTADPWHWARLFSPGHVFFGGLITAIFAVSYFLRIKKIDRPWQYADFFAPGLALGLCLGRIGCFLAGCCYGTTSQFSWLSVHYDGHLAELGPLLPVQLFESVFALGNFVYFLYIYKSTKRDGLLFLGFLTVYSIFRFFVEYFRGDLDRGLWFYGMISTSQMISMIILFVLGGYFSIAFARKDRLKLS